jgi:hypothetical protein
MKRSMIIIIINIIIYLEVNITYINSIDVLLK